LSRRNEYKVYLADQAQIEINEIESKKRAMESELNEARKMNTLIEKLEKVENQVEWANQIKKTEKIREQARIFYEAFRIQLTKQEDVKKQNREYRDAAKYQEKTI